MSDVCPGPPPRWVKIWQIFRAAARARSRGGVVIEQLELYSVSVLIRIDPRAPVPIYAQIEREVRRAVASGMVLEGERLPAARDLATSLDVNMHTVLRAYTELRDAGVIDLRRGRGAVVLPQEAAVPEMDEAVEQLLEIARRHSVPLSRLHQALDDQAVDEGAHR